MSAPHAIGPSDMRAPRLPVGRMVVVALAYLAIALFSTAYPLLSPLNGQFATATSSGQAVDTLWAVLWLAILLVSMARQPEGRLWKFIFLLMATQRMHVLQWVPNSVVWSVARVVDPLWVAIFIHFVVTFPTGYLRDRFDRIVVGLTYGLGATAVLSDLLLAGDWWQRGCNPECVRNVLVFWPNAELHETVVKVIVATTFLLVIPLVMVALWRHWRAAAPAARRTLLPLVVGAPVFLWVLGVDTISSVFGFAPGLAFFDSPSGGAIGLIAPFILPVGLLLAIVRTRLSRGRVASLVVELGRGVPVGGLRDVLARALDDPSLELAFAAPSGAGYVDSAGQPVELPVDDPSRTVTRLEREGELLGVLVHDPAIETEDPGLVEAVGNAARMALENERLAAEVRAQLEEVRASRARIVDAADAERRRVERDLHDGAQQRLVALALRLEVAKKTTPGAEALLDEATGELQTAIGEVRGLARGVHPTILTEAGLRAAVDALAERAPLPVTVDIPERRFDPQVEATAYFVVAEALTNVARYADAGEARVTAFEDEGRLIVTVTDDGRGGADPTAGSGLRGLSDRSAAAGGMLSIASPEGGGTIIRAELPLAAPRTQETTTAPAAGDPSALARVRAVPEASAAPPQLGRVRLSTPMVLIVLAAVSIVVVAVAAALPGSEPRTFGRADAFVRPFDYEVPANSGIRLYPKSDHLQVLSPPPGDGQGISIWAVEDVLKDRCNWHDNSLLVPRQPGVAGLLSYLRSVDGLHVKDIGPLVIDGRPAFAVDLSMDQGAACPDPDSGSMYLWRDAKGTQIQVTPAGHVPLTLLDVDGATIAIEIWSGASDRPDLFDPWLRTAEGIVDSIRFLYRPPAETSPTSPTGAP